MNFPLKVQNRLDKIQKKKKIKHKKPDKKLQYHL